MGCTELVSTNIDCVCARFASDCVSLCGGSITTFSLYGPRFLTELHYTQYQVNAVSIAAELAFYLANPLFGYLCDRYSPRPLSLIAAISCGVGYLLAAFVYSAGPADHVEGYSPVVMVLAFICVGLGTLCVYLAAVATCAKNYANSKYRGLMLAVPFASFGLSGMWESLVGEYLLTKTLSDGTRGEMDVFRYFVFLAGLLVGVGIIGFFMLNIVDDEHDSVECRTEKTERSSLLDDSQIYYKKEAYGAPNTDNSEFDIEQSLNTSRSLQRSKKEEGSQGAQDTTFIFLTDRTMWLLAAGFLLVIGPGEAYINNVGTIIPTLTPKYLSSTNAPAGHASTHVSVIALASTFARLSTGTLSDLFSPTSTPTGTSSPSTRWYLSRLVLLSSSALVLLLGFLNLALPYLTPQIPSLLHVSSALIGFGYGAVFSLVPIIISVVWGAENFATNWGIVAMTPAAGATVWSMIYSLAYSRAADASGVGSDSGSDTGECQGYGCFSAWAWGCAGSTMIAIALWAMAWRAWHKKRVVV